MHHFIHHLCLVSAASILVSCTGDGSTLQKDENDNRCQNHGYLALPSADGTGKPEISIFAGTIDDNRYCIMSVYNHRFSGDGVFVIQLFDSSLHVTSESGHRYTLRGENDATLWECRVDSNDARYYFVCDAANDIIYFVENDSTYTNDYPMPLVKLQELSPATTETLTTD